MNAHFQRAQLLYEQDRNDLAEQELRQALIEEPNNPAIHAILAMCLANQERFEESTAAAQQAIGLGPDFAFAHYSLSRVMFLRNRLNEARDAIEEAIRLEPDDPHYHGQLSAIEFTARRWQPALEAAERGLEIDPEHVTCTNLRVQALTKLGRRTDADAAVEAALHRAPDDAVTHANRGWTLLEQGNPAKAMEHFREALRLDPEMDWAREGIVEALKARHFIYRWMLGYFFWMSRLSTRVQWGIIIGAYVLIQLLNSLGNQHPGLVVITRPLIVAYLIFVVLSWLARPLFNTLLRFNRFGRAVLSSEERWQSNLVCLFLVPALAAGIGFAIFEESYAENYFVAGGIASAFTAIFVGNVFNCSSGWPRRTMAAGAAMYIVISIVMLVLLYRADAGNDQFWRDRFQTAMRWQQNVQIPASLVLFLGGNFLASARPKR